VSGRRLLIVDRENILIAELWISLGKATCYLQRPAGTTEVISTLSKERKFKLNYLKEKK